MGKFQCPHCLAMRENLELLANHMERDDNISPEWITQWLSIFQKPQLKPQSPSPSVSSISTDATEMDLAVARFRVWFVLDGAIIHRREIPGSETFEGFCSQLESLFYEPESKFDVGQFEYLLVGKKRDQEVNTEPFTSSHSYHRMKDKLLEDKSPWRHATVRRIVTALSAFESYAKMRPKVNTYLQPIPNFMMVAPMPKAHPAQPQGGKTPAQPPFRWIAANLPFQTATALPQLAIRWDQPFQAAEASPVQLSLPMQTPVHMPKDSSNPPAQPTAALQSPSSLELPDPKLLPERIRPKGPVKHLFQRPIPSKNPSFGAEDSLTRLKASTLRKSKSIDLSVSKSDKDEDGVKADEPSVGKKSSDEKGKGSKEK